MFLKVNYCSKSELKLNQYVHNISYSSNILSSYCEWIPSYFLMWVDVGRTSLHSPRLTLLNYQINGSVYKHYSKTVTWLSPIHKEWFNSYAPELVPMFHYRDKTRVQMFHFLSKSSIRLNLVQFEWWNHAHIGSWNQPVLSNEGKVSFSRKHCFTQAQCYHPTTDCWH